MCRRCLVTALVLLSSTISAVEAEPDVVRGKIVDREGQVLAEMVDGLRHYPFESIAAHVLGYVGRTAAGSQTVVGRDGVEKTGEADLSAGKDLRLTLDLSKQCIVETVLRENKIGRGSVVVLDPRSGDVIAMASVPSYDLNVFVPVITQDAFTVLQKNPAHPLLNRTMRAQYPPGSVFKTVSALALKNAARKRQCTGTVEIGDESFRCWKREGHGELGLGEALVTSCNCYYFAASQDSTWDAISAFGRQFGFGQQTGIELVAEEGGFMPTAAELEKRFGSAPTSGNTAMLSSGQGYPNATPLQLAAAAAAFANHGKRPAPRLFLDREAIEPMVAQEVDAARMALVRSSMRKVVTDPQGTGRRANSERIGIAGKTGTAQWGARGQTQYVGQFIGFAPYEEPRYAIAVTIEHAQSGGAVSAPIAKQILERFAAIDAGETVKAKPLAPATGHGDLVGGIE